MMRDNLESVLVMRLYAGCKNSERNGADATQVRCWSCEGVRGEAREASCCKRAMGGGEGRLLRFDCCSAPHRVVTVRFWHVCS